MFSWLSGSTPSVALTAEKPSPLPTDEYHDGEKGSAEATGKPNPQGRKRKIIKPLDLPCLNVLHGKRVILASASPRRRQLLAQIGLSDVEIIPSDFKEDLDKSTYSALDYVVETATQKALSVYRNEIDSDIEPFLVLAADTVIVSHLGAVIEKPLSRAHHITMLKELRDSAPHRVFTAVVAVSPYEDGRHPGYAMETHVEETVVKFDSQVTDELIESYVKTGEGDDKAGGYGIQGLGTILVESITGSFDNVVGLPLRGTLKCIEKVVLPDEELQGEGAGVDSDLMP